MMYTTEVIQRKLTALLTYVTGFERTWLPRTIINI